MPKPFLEEIAEMVGVFVVGDVYKFQMDDRYIGDY